MIREQQVAPEVMINQFLQSDSFILGAGGGRRVDGKIINEGVDVRSASH